MFPTLGNPCQNSGWVSKSSHLRSHWLYICSDGNSKPVLQERAWIETTAWARLAFSVEMVLHVDPQVEFLFFLTFWMPQFILVTFCILKGIGLQFLFSSGLLSFRDPSFISRPGDSIFSLFVFLFKWNFYSRHAWPQ